MFVDQLVIKAKAGDGGDGVVRWHREKFKPKGGPSGGDGGRGGDVYFIAVRDLNRLASYSGVKLFSARDGEDGGRMSRTGAGSADLYIEVPVGSVVTDTGRGRVYELFSEGAKERVLRGGRGGYGNEHFKSSRNTAPQEASEGTKGESGEFLVELTLVVDVGLIGLPNAGKSSLLNSLTNARSKVGDYAFTTIQPHLGALYEFVVVDIPGLIEGAAEGKGLGHKFLRHASRTKLLLHLVSLTEKDPLKAYMTVRKELESFKKELSEREEWIILTKNDLVTSQIINDTLERIDKNNKRVFVISTETCSGVKMLKDELVKHLRATSTD